MATISDNLTRIQNAKSAIRASIIAKGVSVAEDAKIDTYSTAIDSIETGGGSTPTPSREGATLFQIETIEDNYEFAINLCNSNTNGITYSIDWGDGTVETGKTTDEQYHTYATKGTYNIEIFDLSGDITLGGSTKYEYKALDSSGNKSTTTTVTMSYLFHNKKDDLEFYVSCYGEPSQLLKHVVIGNNITSIGVYAFSYCSSLQNITIPEGVTIIGVYAFYYCNSLQNITIPEGVTIIGVYAFYYCNSLKSITIPEGVTSIGNYTFYGCSSLQNITIHEGVTSIGDFTFYGCSSLQNITIPEGVTSIGNNTFNGCYSLQSVTLPSTLTSIGDYTFYFCNSLQNITITEGVTSIGNYTFNGCYSLQNITIPEGVTSIGDFVFNGCNSLQNITIPEGVTSIGQFALSSCYSLKSVTLPSTLTSIGNYSFSGCISLKEIICNAYSSPTVKSSTFGNSNYNYTGKYYYSDGVNKLKVPDGAIGYNSSYWSSVLLDSTKCGFTLEE